MESLLGRIKRDWEITDNDSQALKSRNATLKEDLRRAQSQLAKLKKEIEKKDQVIATKDKANGQLEEQITMLEDDLELARAHISRTLQPIKKAIESVVRRVLCVAIIAHSQVI